MNYTYDVWNRLATASNARSQSYTYDSFSNLADIAHQPVKATPVRKVSTEQFQALAVLHELKHLYGATDQGANAKQFNLDIFNKGLK